MRQAPADWTYDRITEATSKECLSYEILNEMVGKKIFEEIAPGTPLAVIKLNNPNGDVRTFTGGELKSYYEKVATMPAKAHQVTALERAMTAMGLPVERPQAFAHA